MSEHTHIGPAVNTRVLEQSKGRDTVYTVQENGWILLRTTNKRLAEQWLEHGARVVGRE